MTSNQARRHSFERHQNVSIEVRPIEQLAEKRAALKRVLEQPPLLDSGCVALAADTKCPRSFGNRYQSVVSGLMTAMVFLYRQRVKRRNSAIMLRNKQFTNKFLATGFRIVDLGI